MTQDYRQRKEFLDYRREKSLRARVSLLRGILVALFITSLSSLWYYQVVRAEHYERLSDSNRIRTFTIPALRGVIRDRHGRVLAKNRSSFTLSVEVRRPEEWIAVRDRLAALLGTEPELLEERRRRGGRGVPGQGIVIQEDVGFEQVSYIESHLEEFAGVHVRVEPRRFYEGGRWAAHAIGYVGEISLAQMGTGGFAGARVGDVVGKAGVERAYEADLSGEPGQRLAAVNAAGRETDDLPGGALPRPGAEIRLTLDLDLQRSLVEAFGDRVGSGVFFDPRSGEILALASLPDFDPNLFAGRFTREGWEDLARDPLHPLQNRATRSRYSAGSTFKIVVAAAALENGLVDPAKRVFCPGHATFYDRKRLCHFGGGHGWVDLHGAMRESCNVYFYHLGREVGIERMAAYARKMGLGKPTGLEVLGEDSGLVPDEAWSRKVRGTPWYPGETISVSIGQGPLLVTPLQLAAMVGAVGSGQFQQLRLVASLGGRPLPRHGPAPPLDLSERTLKILRRALWGVVNEGGTGARARLTGTPGVRVAGKTGTVQVVRASAGVDSRELPEELRDHSWFVGYAPSGAPTIAFAVFVEHGGHGGDQAAPIARQVLETFFQAGRGGGTVDVASTPAGRRPPAAMGVSGAGG